MPRQTDAGWLVERVRDNVRVLKAARRMSNLALAESGGFANRQTVDNRIGGRSAIGCDDLARLAAGLRVEPHVLLLRTDEALRWVHENPDYEPIPVRKQRKSTVKSKAMRARRAQA